MEERTCYNCEVQTAKFVCRQCPTEESYFCNGCSIVHPTIRAFRGHVLDPIQMVTSTANMSSDTRKKRNVRFKESGELSQPANRNVSISVDSVGIEEYSEEYEDDVSSIVENIQVWFRVVVDKYTRADDWQSQGVVMLTTFFVYWIVKQALGNVSVVLLITLAYLAIRKNTANDSKDEDGRSPSGLWGTLATDVTRFLGDANILTGTKKVENSEEMESVRRRLQELQKSGLSSEEDDFKEEFWHHANQAPVRKRPLKVEIKNRSKIIIR